MLARLAYRYRKLHDRHEHQVAVGEGSFPANLHFGGGGGGDHMTLITCLLIGTCKCVLAEASMPSKAREVRNQLEVTMASQGTLQVPAECLPRRLPLPTYDNNISEDLGNSLLQVIATNGEERIRKQPLKTRRITNGNLMPRRERKTSAQSADEPRMVICDRRGFVIKNVRGPFLAEVL